MIDRWDWLVYATDAERAEFAGYVAGRAGSAWVKDWGADARPEQKPPPGDWRVWLVMAGRGFGKTRTGAEWVRAIAEAQPAARIAIVAASLVEARAVMIEGESGVIACSPPDQRPKFEPSLRRVVWPNGAQAALFSAAEPESLRGPQHSHARGPGAEGIHRQRGAVARRSGTALHDRGRSSGTARQPVGGAGVVGRDRSYGRVRRPRRSGCWFYRKRLAIHRRANGVAGLRQSKHVLSPLYRFLATLCRPGHAQRRHHYR